MAVLRLALWAVLVISAQGCLLPFGPRRSPRVDIAQIQTAPLAKSEIAGIVVTTGDLDRAYEEVAIVTVGPRGLDSTEDLIRDLRLAAVRAQADAVVRVDFDQYAGEDEFTKRIATGTAVHFLR